MVLTLFAYTIEGYMGGKENAFLAHRLPIRAIDDNKVIVENYLFSNLLA